MIAKNKSLLRKTALVFAVGLAALSACLPQAPDGAAPSSLPARTSTPTPGSGSGPASSRTPLPLSATLSEASGGVDVKQPEQADFASAAPPLVVQVEGQVRTREDGRARLDLSTGTILRLAPLTLFTLQTNQAVEDGLLTRIKLLFGQLYILLNGGSVEVETDSGFAAVRGSYMRVEVEPLSGATLVQCLEGTCEARNPSGAVTLTGGQGAVLPHTEAGRQPDPPKPFKLSEEDVQQWLEDNPEVLPLLPTLQATLTAQPPLPTREGLLPTLIASRTPIFPLPTLAATRTPIFPLPTLAATRTPILPLPTKDPTRTPILPLPTKDATSTPILPLPTKDATSTPIFPLPTKDATRTPIFPRP